MEDDELNTDQAEELIRQAAELGVRIFVFSGGEPLMRPDLFHLIGLAKSLNMQVALATNGTMLNDDFVQKIIDSGVSRVSVSIDSHEAQAHDQFRGQVGAFDAAINGMILMRKLGQPFQINTTVTRRNMNSLDKAVSLAEDIGAAALHLFFLVPVGCGLEIPENERITAEEYETLLHWFAGKMKESSMEMRATCAPHLQRVILQTNGLSKKTEATQTTGHPQATGHGDTIGHGNTMGHGHKVSKGCLAGSGIVFVSSKGDVRPCGYMNLTVGNILDAPLEDLWHNDPNMIALRDSNSLTGHCGDCSFRFKCGGCRSRALAVSGDLFGDEPMCTWGANRKKR
jgi:radical SAM protein with 4Fe4S-binding SPASM domain